jgi:hypothetical protein
LNSGRFTYYTLSITQQQQQQIATMKQKLGEQLELIAKQLVDLQKDHKGLAQQMTKGELLKGKEGGEAAQSGTKSGGILA